MVSNTPTTATATNIVGTGTNVPRQWNPPHTLIYPEAARFCTVDAEYLVKKAREQRALDTRPEVWE